MHKRFLFGNAAGGLGLFCPLARPPRKNLVHHQFQLDERFAAIKLAAGSLRVRTTHV